MDNPGGNRRRGGGHQSQRGQKMPQNPQLFDDTSTHPSQQPYASPPTADPQATFYNPAATSYGYPAPHMAPGGYEPAPAYANNAPAMFNDPMAHMAMQYGTGLADKGKDIITKNLENYVSTSKLKYYFAVDTSYVGRKLGLLLFPYAHQDWSLSYNQDEPVAPRYDVNAPDLYIPVMAFVTFLLLAGVSLGTHDKFSPEMLGLQASSTLVWLVIELVILLLTLYVLHISTDITYLDLLAYCGYKYVGMIVVVTTHLILQSDVAYFASLLWMSCALAFFLVRTLRLAIIPHTDAGADNYSHERGSKRRLYCLLIIALSQPVFMWWLTRYVAVYE